jgi:hypothetical protein
MIRVVPELLGKHRQMGGQLGFLVRFAGVPPTAESSRDGCTTIWATGHSAVCRAGRQNVRILRIVGGNESRFKRHN